jgi:hypothetical protein
MLQPQAKLRPDQGAVVTKAVLRAGEQLGLSGRQLGTVIGLSEPTVSRMRRAEYQLDPSSKSFELALLFIRLFRSLDAIVGGDAAVARAWLANENSALAARPLDSIQTIAGLVNVVAYLDARRAVI